MSRSCVCGGNNENCRFCYGSGVLPHNLGSSSKKSRQQVATKQTRVGAGKVRQQPERLSMPTRIQCPKGCGRWLKLNMHKLQGHIKN